MHLRATVVAILAIAGLLGCSDAGTEPPPTTPTTPGPLASGASIAAGTDFSCALASGAAYCWGTNGLGQLGNPAVANEAWVPSRVSGAGTYVAIAANATNQAFGPSTACALQADGAADCWGSDPEGLIGPPDPVTCIDSGTTPRSTGTCMRVPTRVAPTLRFRRIIVGWGHVCGVLADSTGVCWGRGTEGQLGDGSVTSSGTPVRVAITPRLVDIVASDKFTCALAVDGSAYCWGLNNFGQLGDGSITSRATPGRVPASAPFRQIDAGSEIVCGVTPDGTTLCWGHADFRALGSDGSFARLPNTATYWPTPVVVPLPAATQRVSAGTATACALDATARLRCWGYNVYGTVGTTDATRCTTSATSAACLPADVDGDLRFAEFSAGGLHTCGRTTAGDLYCWGRNFRGNLGRGDRRNSSVPVRVTAP
jgi:alpha-tubulin suppressor-like RCC1 family protein